MERGEPLTLLFVSNNGSRKKDLIAKFEDTLLEFKRNNVNGSITLHFSEGYLSKLHCLKVD